MRDDPGRAGRVGLDLGPQPLDVHVERLGVADVVAAPHTVDQRLARQHPPGVGEQQVQQLELLQRQRHLCAVDGDAVLVGVEDHVADGKRRRPTAQTRRRRVDRRSAQHGTHAGDELADAVRLGDVVVGADLEPDDGVDLGALGGDHDDRHVARACAAAGTRRCR